MIVSRIQGGLGNQMFQYAFGLYLAERNATELVLDIATLERDALRSYMLDRMATDARLLTVAEGRLLPRCRGGHGWWNVLRGSKSLRRIHEKPFGFDPHYLSAGPHVYLDGYWQSEQFFPNLRQRLQCHFRPVGLLHRSSAELALRMEQAQSVSVHVRRGDYVLNPVTLSVHGICSPAYYYACVDALLARFEDVHLYVFSDDHPWCKKHLQFLCPTTHVEYYGGAAACEDMWLMTRCRHHIVANSSFSWWGAWLRADQSGAVYAPRQWFQDPNLNSQSIVPVTWIKVAGQASSQREAA